MHKLIITSLILFCLALSGCSIFRLYQPDVQQGNVTTQAMVAQLRPGMSKEQAANILGLPVLQSTFNEDHWAYVYTFQYSGGKISQHTLNLYFNNNRLVRLDGSYPLPF